MLETLKNLFGKKPAPQTPVKPIPAPPEPIQSPRLLPTEVKAKLDRGEPLVLVDVREPEEVEIASIHGALHIPMGEIYHRYKEIAGDPNTEIIVFCHHGGRSERVMNQLWGLGYPNVKNMSGGIDRWSAEVDPSVPRY